MKKNTPTLVLIALLGSTALWFVSSAMSGETNDTYVITDEVVSSTKNIKEDYSISNVIEEVIPNFDVREVGTPPPLVKSAREQIGITVSYDPAYVKLDYPMGDVPKDRGVCTDVVVRAYREQGKDLQALVRTDMKKAWSQYPKIWGLKSTDKNIDHRRVPNLRVFFERNGKSLSMNDKVSGYKAEDFLAGDLVTWTISGRPHIGIVSNKVKKNGTPLIIHNIGRGTQEEDVLFAFKITGHYRY